jgi:hypothetical protein
VLNHDLGLDPQSRLSAFLDRLRQVATNNPDLRTEIRIVAVESSKAPARWYAAYGEIAIARPGDLLEGCCLTYPRVRALYEAISVQDFLTRFDVARSGAPFQCCGIQFEEHGLDRTDWWISAFPSFNEWSRRPCLVAKGQQVSSPNAPRPLVGPENPYFDSIGELIQAVQTLPVFHGGRDDRNDRFSVILNDYRGNFVGYRQDEDRLVIEAAGDNLEESRFVGRIAVLDGLHQVNQPASTEQAIELPEWARNGSFSLMAPDGEILDYLQIPLPLSISPRKDESRSDFVHSLLLGGENAVAEFKPWMDLTGEKFDRALESVVAMANGNGGHVVIGVDDHGDPAWVPKILGKFMDVANKKRKNDGNRESVPELESELGAEVSRDEELRSRAADLYARALRDQIQKNISVSPVISFEIVNLDRDVVALLWVEPGQHRPYQDKRSNRTFVRSNATNRSPTPAETHELCMPRGAG